MTCGSVVVVVVVLATDVPKYTVTVGGLVGTVTLTSGALVVIVSVVVRVGRRSGGSRGRT